MTGGEIIETRPERLLEDEHDAESRRLEQTWGSPSGLKGFLTTTDHKRLGLRIIVTAFGFFLLGGILAVLMRIQLATPENRFLSADLYNQIFTIHGTTMMFLFAVPVMQGMGIYLVPLMVGTRNIAFPRMVAFGYWMFLFGGLMMYVFFILGTGPDRGWFSYVPLAGPQFGIGKRADVWAQLVNFTELAGLLFAIAVIVTVLKQRAPGMSIDRIPLFVWSMLVVSIMVIFAMPAVMTSSLFLALDRLVGTHFYNPAEGGDALLWQHLFWFFAHPEVYIIFLPALGMISAILPSVCRRSVFGYPAIVLATVATGFLGFGLWVHHMFTTGLPQLGESFFTAASLMIAIPTGTQIFCWIATIWGSRPRFTTSFLFVLAFFFTFMIGGLSGVMLASVPIDTQVHDTFFVVSHFHYVLIGGSLFPLFGAFYHWFAKAFGRMLGEVLGRWNFAFMFVGFQLVFFPMHQLGLEGMPRRVYTYTTDAGWADLNLFASLGVIVLGTGVLLFITNVVLSLRRGGLAGPNPVGGESSEWLATSPPVPSGFVFVPVVKGREPAWEHEDERAHVVGLLSNKREVLITRLLDAEPDHKTIFPVPSVWPFVSAIVVGAMFIGAIFTPWAAVAGVSLALIPMIAWFWPKEEEEEGEGGSPSPPEHVRESADETS